MYPKIKQNKINEVKVKHNLFSLKKKKKKNVKLNVQSGSSTYT